MNVFWSLLGVLSAVVLILLLAWVTTRWIGLHGAGQLSPGAPAGAGGPLAVLWQAPAGRSGQLLLLRLGERCCLLGVTERQITPLMELEGEEAAALIAAMEREAPPPGFLEILSTRMRKKQV